MRKLITLLLIAALLLPAAALAADRDPIVGCWYMFFDGYLYPEFSSAFGEDGSEVSIYYFMESGTIMLMDNVLKEEVSIPTYDPCGKWEKTDNGYRYSLVGLGEGEITLHEDALHVFAPNTTAYMIMRKLIPFNPYTDYTY